MLENRLIKALRPPGNKLLKNEADGYVYLRCRLDIPFPILEVAREPAAGNAVCVGPVRGRAAAAELVEQLNSLFGLRHCGRALPRREHPSAYGQMGRCLSPCLGDLDPNLYRERLDGALGLFEVDGGAALLAHVDAQMRAASARAALRARGLAAPPPHAARVAARAARRRPARGPRRRPARARAAPGRRPARADAFWIVAGRVADWGPLPADPDEVAARTAAALAPRRPPASAAGCPPTSSTSRGSSARGWPAHEARVLELDPRPDRERWRRGAAALRRAQRERAPSVAALVRRAAGRRRSGCWPGSTWVTASR